MYPVGVERHLVTRGNATIQRQYIVLAHGPALLRGKQHGATLEFDAAPARAADRPVIDALVTKMFALDLDVAPFWHRARREPGFAELVRRCVELRPQRFPTLFEALANGICCQQFSLASKTS